MWGHKCGFQRANGTYCERWAIKGGYCCPKHGGQLPVVRAAAKARLRSLVPLALDVMEDVLRSTDDPKELARVRVARDVLRLNGITSTEPSRRRGRPAKAALPAPAEDTDAEIEALLAAVTKPAKPAELTP